MSARRPLMTHTSLPGSIRTLHWGSASPARLGKKPSTCQYHIQACPMDIFCICLRLAENLQGTSGTPNFPHFRAALPWRVACTGPVPFHRAGQTGRRTQHNTRQITLYFLPERVGEKQGGDREAGRQEGREETQHLLCYETNTALPWHYGKPRAAVCLPGTPCSTSHHPWYP